jgi:hypothetical protein
VSWSGCSHTHRYLVARSCRAPCLEHSSPPTIGTILPIIRPETSSEISAIDAKPGLAMEIR